MIAVMIARRSISASSVPAGAAVVKATGAGAAGAGAAGAAGAGAFFLFSKTLMYLKQLIKRLIKISTMNTVPIPIRVFNAAFSMFSPRE